MSAENVSLALKALRDGKRPTCPWCQSPMADVRMAEEDGETYGHATWMCGYCINWVVGDIEHDQCTIKLAAFDGKLRMCWEWEIATLRAEVEELKEEVAMGDQCLQMIRELLSAIDRDSPSTPPMMFPEWIASVMAKKETALRAEVAALKEALRTYGDHPEDCPPLFHLNYRHGLAGKGDK
jgi:hypothetical protein